ncbi:MAG: T9SS type A sorting domain-containing protein, partial [Bacteroidia bacterium]
NTATCSWDVTGTQPEAPATACYESATFNTATCSWDVTGTQPEAPATACYESATFKTATCSWDVTGTQPEAPATACYETASFNGVTCSWDVTGTQPEAPATACYESASFNTTTCSWDVTGTQPEAPATACYETASFNAATCSWDVTGTQPEAPATACYESASFNTATCSWDVTGTQPEAPATACYETASFNGVTCSWDVSGTQPEAPATACNETAAFNSMTCSWDITAAPTCGTNLIVNGNFELGNTGFVSGYTFKADVAGNTEMIPENTYGVGPNVATYHPSLVGLGRTGNFLMVNGNIQTIKTVWSQSVNVVAGKQYQFKAYVQNTFPASPAVLQFSVGTSLVGTLSAPGLATYTEFAAIYTASTSGVVELKIVDANLTKTGNDFGIDDISFSEICPTAPATACYETATYNASTCSWDITGTMPEQPATACYETASFNTVTCSWDVSGTQPEAPATACYETASFNNASCSWDVTGTQPEAPATACYETASFNAGTCSWDVTGTQPEQPAIESYQTATFNNVTCSWDITGTPPVSGCYAVEVYAFNQGLTKMGTAVRPERSIASNALGAPNGQNPAVYAPVQNFVSLGFAGSIELRFETPIANGPGADIKIWESSASVNNETAVISVSQDGLGYTPVGTITQGGELDFGTAFSDYIQFVRIVDVTNAATWGNSSVSDGYDVDAIECLHGAYIIPEPVSCSAVEVVSFVQGPVQDLVSPVAAERSIVANALGTPENSDATTAPANNNFLTLGFGGEIVLKFGYPVKNGPGNDLFVVETTFGSATVNNCTRYPERIRAFASQDGCNWVYLGEGCQDTYFDFQTLGWAQYVKLIDVTPVLNFANGGDAYDLDGILCLHGEETNPVPAAFPAGATEVVTYNPGLRKNGTPVTADRTNPSKALGTPENNSTVNFVSLGFGGNLVLKFPYVIFDNPVENDLQVVETSFGNPSCAAYPEKAEFEGSLDGISWISLGELCLDGQLNVGAAGAIQYLRISDRSAASAFSGTADGYDVDGIVAINSLCASAPTPRIMDDVTAIDEVSSLTLFPNPATEYTVVRLEGTQADEAWTIELIDAAGRIVAREVVKATVGVSEHFLKLNAYESGVYTVRAFNNSNQLIERLVK